MPHLIYPHKAALLGGVSPVVLGIFTNQLNDFTTLSTLSAMPTGGSISRAGNAYYFDNTGTLQTASTNTARFDNAWNGSAWVAKGLLIEGARTNVFLNSATPATQSITVTAQAYTLSFYGTGTITLSGASTAGPLVGTGANNRVTLTFTPSAASLTLTLSGTITYPQLEAGSFASSYIVCGGTATTRNAETFAITGYSSNLIEAYYTDEATGGSWSLPYNAGVAPSPSYAWLTSLRVYSNAYAGDIASPSWIDNSGTTGNRMYYDSTGTLTWCPANMLLNSATLSTQSITTLSQTYILSFKGTGSVTCSGTNTTVLAGTGASNRVSAVLTCTAGTLTLTVSGTVTEAQVEPVTYQTSPRAYIPTTSAAVYQPRYDFDPSTVPATPRGMLIEESRANLLTYSQRIDGSSPWYLLSATISTNAAVAPDGTTTASKIIEANSSAISPYVYYGAFSAAAATTYTLSVYVKAAERTRAAIVWPTVAGNNPGVIVDLLTGAVVSTGGSPTVVVTNAGNGWWRVCMTATTGNPIASNAINFGPTSNATSFTGTMGYNGDGVSGIYIWGAQLEAGSFATSYIPTTSASVTRVADVVKLSGSALTTISGTSVSAIAEINGTPTAAGQLISTGADTLLAQNSSTQIYTLNNVPAAVAATLGSGLTTSLFRGAVAYNPSSISIVGNNGSVVTSPYTYKTVPANNPRIGSNTSGYSINTWYRSIALYNQKLPDAILKSKSIVGAPY